MKTPLASQFQGFLNDMIKCRDSNNPTFLVPKFIVVTFSMLGQIYQHPQIKQNKFILAYLFFKNSAQSWWGPRQESYSRRFWWRKAAHIRVARKQRMKRRDRKRNIYFQVIALSDPHLPTGSHHLTVHAILNLMSVVCIPSHFPKTPLLNTWEL